MNTQYILVIGAGGGIGAAVVARFAEQYPNGTVYAVSRSAIQFTFNNVQSHQIQTDDDNAISHWLTSLNGIKFSYVVGAMGVLHGEHKGVQLAPEKKLEDLNQQQLLTYFTVNSVVPSLWTKHLVRYVHKSHSAICFISARVGSIEDNKMGGWYGYRASKAALNMLIKSADIEYRRRTKRTAFVSYHPGTVDTGLSKPFQANVKTNKLFTPAFTAERLVSLVTSVDVTQGPYYLDWDNKSVPW